MVTPELKPIETASKYTFCVTGAAGYIAAQVVQRLLAAGHIVHGTVRNPDDSKVTFLKSLPNSENLKLFAADLLKEGSFDEAVRGCDYVFHTASPFFMKVSSITTYTLLLISIHRVY